jgi:alpha-amylase
MPTGRKVLDVSAVFADGTRVRDAYSGRSKSLEGKLKSELILTSLLEKR